MVNGVSLGTCLGDLYSVNWMENLDNQTNDIIKIANGETLELQYEAVKTKTTLSHVMQYGDLE